MMMRLLRTRSIAILIWTACAVWFAVAPAGAQTPTPLPLLDAFHIPSQVIPDPPGTTMRDPLEPGYQDTVDIYCGIPTAADVTDATLYVRLNGSGAWFLTALTPFSQHGATDYRHGQIDVNMGDTMVEYYVEVVAQGYTTTFVYGDDFSDFRTDSESTAQAGAFRFDVLYPTPGTPTPQPSFTPATTTPTPTATMTPQVVTPTPTPSPALPFELEIYMPDRYLEPGDHCMVSDRLYNRTDVDASINLFFILDVYGSFFFFPSWASTGIDYAPMVLRRDSQPFTYVILDFPWSEEENYPPTFGLRFWSAMMDEQVTQLIGNVDTVEFGYGPEQ